MSYPVFQVPAGDVLPVLFSSYAGSTGASVTLTGLAVTDIEIYKDGSTTQRASDAGYTLLDTDGIDFDGITGVHGFSIDTGDNTDAGFYTVGAWFTVVVSAVTIDSQTVNFIACQFRLMPAESVAGKPKVDVDTFGGTVGTFSGGRPEVNTTHAAGTAWGSGAITAASIAADAITAAKIADGAIDAATFAIGAITAASLAADAGAEIADAVWDEALAGHATAGTAGAALSAAGSAGDPWSTLLPGAYGAGTAGKIVGDNINATISSRSTLDAAAVRTAVGLASANLDTQIAAVQADTDNLQTRIPAALTGAGNMKVDVLAVDGDADGALNLRRGVLGTVVGTVGAASTTTSIVTSSLDPAASVTDQFKGRIVTFDKDTTTAALRGQATDITANTSAGVLTVTALTTAPASGDTFCIT